MFIIIGWQEDDLPLFGEIKDILIINFTYFFVSESLHDCGY